MSSTDEILDRLYAAFVGEGSPDRQLLADVHQEILRMRWRSRREAARHDRVLFSLACAARNTDLAVRGAVEEARATLQMRHALDSAEMYGRAVRAEQALAALRRLRRPELAGAVA